MSRVFETIGIVFTILTVGLTAAAMVLSLVFLPIDAGWWAMERFGARVKEETVVLRQDARAKPIWICADGTAKAPRNCLSRDELLKVLRARR